MNIVVVNSGSSSLKMSMFRCHGSEVPTAAEWVSEQDIDWQSESTAALAKKVQDTLSQLWLGKEGNHAILKGPADVNLVGHRIVHGGAQYKDPIEITDQVQKELDKLTEFAPLHNPINMKAVAVVKKILPEARHVGVFDTAFHATIKPEASVYPAPYSWCTDLQIKKYGFHGINHKYCGNKAAKLLDHPQSLRLVSCHLGGGCSLAAIKDGVSIETTMGFTPLDGLMMRSRSGSIDPGVLIYLLKTKKYTVDELDVILNKESGMKGIFEKSADLRDILKAMKSGDERAKLTFDMFIHRLVCGIGSMVAALGGLDALVFTGGIGEHSSLVRSVVCEKLSFLNIEIDESLNNKDRLSNDMEISNDGSKIKVFLITAREDWQIATESSQLLANK